MKPEHGVVAAGILMAYGAMVLIGSAIMGWLVLTSPRHTATEHLPAPSALLPLVSWGVLAGAGALGRRKWGALLLAVPGAILGLILAVGSVVEVPFPFNVVNMVVGLVLALPAALAYMGWRVLRWW